MKITKDGFVWKTVNHEIASSIFYSNVSIQIFKLHNNEAESLIENSVEFEYAVYHNAQFGIEVANINDKGLFILFSTDEVHRYANNDFLGIYTSHENAVLQAIIHSEKSQEGKLSKHDIFLLGDKDGGIKQTQGRDENYIIETT